MRTTPLAYLAAMLALAACSKASGTTVQDTPTAPSASKSNQQGITWGPAPAFLPPGAQIAVLEGDPTAAGTFTYTFVSEEIVDPSALRIVDQTMAYTATMFACHPPGSCQMSNCS